MSYAQHVSRRQTPQTEPIHGKPMVPNSGGGFGFAVSDWDRLDRFLILGNDGGSYYASERKMTIENADCVLRCAVSDFQRTLDTVVRVSDEGLAPKNDPAIFALALLSSRGNPNDSKALAVLSKVCRIGTHLFQFMEMLRELRGRGPAVRRAIGEWYTGKQPQYLAYQVTKYAQRKGHSHRDLLRLVKPQVEARTELAGVLAWVTGNTQRKQYAAKVELTYPGASLRNEMKVANWFAMPDGAAKTLLLAVDAVKAAKDKHTVERLIRDHRLVWEVVPTEWFNEPEIWDALLENMPPTAMLRNLGKMSAVGLLKPFSPAVKVVIDRFGDVEQIRKSRLHPFTILVGLTTYAAGRGVKGDLTWTPVPQITAALDAAFYTAFGNVTPTGKNWLLGLDVSGSMSGLGSKLANTHIFAREAAAAMAMVAMRTEPNVFPTAFSHGIMPLDILPQDSLSTVVRKMNGLPFSSTDCSLPMVFAMHHKLDVDVFVIYTDAETNVRTAIHPCQALQQYRQQSGRPAKLIVVGMVSNGFTIADPSDGGMMDVVGFDTSAPEVMSGFVRGPSN